MNTKEIRDLALAEIETKLRATRDELLMLRLKKNTGQIEKPHILRVLRKDIARLQTILREKSAKAA
ncbi:MAG TPA: 50S ribosomal protein L29 [Opitutaceae bacterium]|nr:50S ribosomal protein L29 [Opitutaceae bacterium]